MTTKPKVFKEEQLQTHFERDGYVVIPRVLDSILLEAINGFYEQNSPKGNSGFYVTNWMSDLEFNQKAHEFIKEVLVEKLDNLLQDYKPVLGCFAVKESNGDNAMGLHQDWSVVDESECDGVSAWIPLIDVAEETGAVKVLKGSHRLFPNIRGQKIVNPLEGLNAENIHQYLSTVSMQAGDLLVLHHRLVHCSGASNSGVKRIAAMLAMIPKQASVKHYLAAVNYEQTKQIRVFNCPDDFYVHFDITSEPNDAIELQLVYQPDFPITNELLTQHYS